MYEFETNIRSGRLSCLRFAFCIAIGVALLAAGTGVDAKRKRGAASQGSKMGRAEISDAVHALKSPNPEEVRNAVFKLAASGSSSAVGPLTDLLRTGPRDDITDAVIQALGAIGSSRSVTILIEYLNHRRPDARIAAIYALQTFEGDQVTKALEDTLRDSDAQVRAAAATALGARASESSVPILFLAFDRGVHEAAISIGQMGDTKDATRLAEYLGKVDVNVLLPGFDEFLRRSDFPTKAKREILEQLFELAGPDVRRFAVAYKASFPPGTKEDENDLYKIAARMVRNIQED